MEDILVLGAGLTGCSVAMELARQGRRVTLVDRYEQPLRGASLRNEGKIHLGFVYAEDRSFATAELQLRGALTFAPLLDRWAGRTTSPELELSTPFAYLVAKNSLTPAPLLEKFYARVNRRAQELLQQFPGLHYLGERPESFFLGEHSFGTRAWYPTEETPHAYLTRELAVDTEALARLVSGLVAAEPLIEFRGGITVNRLNHDGSAYQLQVGSDDAESSLTARTVVNCSWENRLGFDAMVGLDNPPGHLHRLKYRLLATCPPTLEATPSATRVLGPYGDVVIRPGGKMFLSWYPEGLGWSEALHPPQEWYRAISGDLTLEDQAGLVARMLQGIAPWFPQVYDAELLSIDAGPIIAWGSTDINQAGSGLHRRDLIGSRRSGNFWSIEAGKLTTAPLAGYECARKILNAMENEEYDQHTFSDRLLDDVQRGSFSSGDPGDLS